MLCRWRCFEIGGPFIAENPECPFHGRERVPCDHLLHEGTIVTFRWGDASPEVRKDILDLFKKLVEEKGGTVTDLDDAWKEDE